MAPVYKIPNNITIKKQTGTKPKTTTIQRDLNDMNASSRNSLESNQLQTQLLNETNKGTHSSKNRSSCKNTEIVAPTRRDLNDLNDYFICVTNESKNYNNNQTNSAGIGNNSTGQLEPNCFELENLNFQENQRYCYPVRPIPRRNITNNKSQTHHQDNITALPTNSIPNNINNNNINLVGTTVGVVQPTTSPGNLISTEDRYNSTHQQQLQQNNNTQQKVGIAQSSLGTTNQNFNLNNTDLSWEDRLNFIQYFLSLTSKSKPYNNSNKRDITIKSNMVNEKNDEIFNSASLEDVAHDTEDATRAQSISSIHTVTSETASAPNYDELQARLEHSNRNIQNIKDQQQQLLRLQEAAKQHLSEMQNLRANLPIRCTQLNGENTNAPDYESVEEVHSDMTNIVNRMKNLQHFIQGQNELSAMLGDDSPDLLAEQELLQKKLDDLKSHRQEMKNLVTELQDINTTVEESIHNKVKENNQDDISKNVPIEYQRVVPIELVGNVKKIKQEEQSKGNTAENHGAVRLDTGEEPLMPHANEVIQQKVADINAMKQQLQRLKDMMATVKLIEEKTEHGKPPSAIGVEERVRIEVPVSIKKEFGTNFTQQSADGSEQGEEKMLVERVRLLQEMTCDLRNQAISLSSESDRLRSIKDEIKRKCDENRESAETVRASFNGAAALDDDEKDLLKQEYEIKKKEFEKICQRLNSEEENNEVESVTTIEATNEVPIFKTEEEKPINNQFTESWRNANVSNFRSSSSFHGSSSQVQSQPQALNSSSNIPGKDSTDSGAVDVNCITSLEAGSIQSDSSRSFSMPPPPPPIRQMSWRKNSQDHSSAATTSSTLPLYDQIPLAPPVASVQWQPYYYMYPPYNFSMPIPGAAGNNPVSAPANDFLCTHSTLGSTALQNAAGSSQNVSPDPVLLQQFIQTQQMLINSVCQCNQLLWHQQREINNLNNTVNLLQERLLNSAPNADVLHSMRSDSVPPHSTVSSNNIFLHRAQSEQPLNPGIPSTHFHSAPQPLSPTQRSNYQSYSHYNNFQRRNMNNQYQNQNLQQQQQQQHISTAAGYNYSTDQSSGTYTMHNIPNNIHHSMNFNNGVPQSPTSILNNNNSELHQQHVGPTPIFMNHHNNNISSATANTLHSINNHNTNLLNSIHNSQQQQQNTSNSALNNQVPPGNRANNYWDNFRSYSRQNLLSNTTCKSKSEDQTRQQIQRLQQPQQLQYHQQPSETRNFQQSNIVNPQFNTNVTTTAQNPYRTNAISNSLTNNGRITENVFDFNAPVINTNAIVAALGSPDFRNMNFNFRSNERKKLPSKTSKAKHLHHSSYNSNVGINLFPRNDIEHNNFENWITDEDGAIGYDDETTSEEIKRNLLVNALKNDKFTSKFFETLQEDVYRQAYRIIQEKKSDRVFLLKLIDELKDSSAYNPLKNILLNSLNNSHPVVDQRKQAEQMNQNGNGTDSNDGDNEMDATYIEIDDHNIMSNSLPNRNINVNNNIQLENLNFSSNIETLHDNDDTPSSDKATRLINHKDTKILTNNKVNSKQKKNDTEIEQKINITTTSSPSLRPIRPDVVLVKYVIQNIRKEFNLSQPTNETIIIRMAKSICNHLDNAIKNLNEKPRKFNWIKLTPKHVYDAIQNFDSNQDFIINLRNYLMEEYFILNNDTISSHEIKSNISRNSEIKIENNLDGLAMVKNKNSKQPRSQKPFFNMNEAIDNRKILKGGNTQNNRENNGSHVTSNSNANIAPDSNEEGAIALPQCNDTNMIIVDDSTEEEEFIWRTSDVWDQEIQNNENLLMNDEQNNLQYSLNVMNNDSSTTGQQTFVFPLLSCIDSNDSTNDSILDNNENSSALTNEKRNSIDPSNSKE